MKLTDNFAIYNGSRFNSLLEKSKPCIEAFRSSVSPHRNQSSVLSALPFVYHKTSGLSSQITILSLSWIHAILSSWVPSALDSFPTFNLIILAHHLGFLGGSDCKESVCSLGDLGSIPGLGRSPGEGNGHLLQYSYLENSMVRGARWATVSGVAESQTWLSGPII